MGKEGYKVVVISVTVISIFSLTIFVQILRGKIRKKKNNEDMVVTGSIVKSFYGNSGELNT